MLSFKSNSSPSTWKNIWNGPRIQPGILYLQSQQGSWYTILGQCLWNWYLNRKKESSTPWARTRTCDPLSLQRFIKSIWLRYLSDFSNRCLSSFQDEHWSSHESALFRVWCREKTLLCSWIRRKLDLDIRNKRSRPFRVPFQSKWSNLFLTKHVSHQLIGTWQGHRYYFRQLHFYCWEDLYHEPFLCVKHFMEHH